MLQLPSPNVAAETQLLPSYKGTHAYSGCPSWLSFITVVIQAHAVAGCQRNQVLRKSYVPHVACTYCVKLQRQEYTEQRTPDNIYIYKKSQFNSLVWGSLTLAPIKFHVQFNTSLLASNSRFSFQILFWLFFIAVWQKSRMKALVQC